MADSQNTQNLSEVLAKYFDKTAIIDIRQITSTTNVRMLRTDAVKVLVESIKRQGWINDSVVYVMLGGERETEDTEVPRQQYVLIEGAHRFAALKQLAAQDPRYYRIPVSVLRPMPLDAQLFVGMALNTQKKATVTSTFVDTLQYLNKMSRTLVLEVPAIKVPHPDNDRTYFQIKATTMFKHLSSRGLTSGEKLVTFRSYVHYYNWLGSKGYNLIELVADSPCAKIFTKSGLTSMSKICAQNSTALQRYNFIKAAYKCAQASKTHKVTEDDLKTIRLQERIAAGEVPIITGKELPTAEQVFSELLQQYGSASAPGLEGGPSREEREGGPATGEVVAEEDTGVELSAGGTTLLEGADSAARSTSPAPAAASQEPTRLALVAAVVATAVAAGETPLEGAESAARSTSPAPAAASQEPSSKVPSLADVEALLGHAVVGAEDDRTVDLCAGANAETEAEPSAGGAARVTASPPQLEAVQKRLADAAANKKFFADRKRAREAGGEGALTGDDNVEGVGSEASAGEEERPANGGGTTTEGGEAGSVAPGVSVVPESSAATADDEAKFGLGEDTAPLAESSATDKRPPGGRCHMCVGFDHLLVTYGDDGNGHRCVVCKCFTHSGGCGSISRRVLTCRRCLSQINRRLAVAAATRVPQQGQKRKAREMTLTERTLADKINAAYEKAQEKKRRALQRAKAAVSAQPSRTTGIEAETDAGDISRRINIRKMTEKQKAAIAAAKAHKAERNKVAEARRQEREARQKAQQEEAAARRLELRQQRAEVRKAAAKAAEDRAGEGQIFVEPQFVWPTNLQDAYKIALAESAQYETFQFKHFTEYLFLLTYCPHLKIALTNDRVPNIGLYAEAEGWWAEYASNPAAYRQLMEKYYKEESIPDAAHTDETVAAAADKRASTRSAARSADLSAQLPAHIKDPVEEVGYVLLPNQFTPNEQLLRAVRACALGGTTIFNNPSDAPGKSGARVQRVFDPYVDKPASQVLADFGKQWAQNFKELGLNSSDWAALHSHNLCRGQYPHVDYVLTPEIRRARATGKVAMPLVAEFGLEPGSSVVVWPRSHKPPFTERIQWLQVPLPPGSILIMRGDLFHAGAPYRVENTRLHVYLDTPSIVHERGMTYKLEADEEARPFIMLPPYM